MPIWTFGCFWDSILGQVESHGWSSETRTLQFPSHCGIFPDFGLGHDSYSCLNLSYWTSPQSNSCVIWKEFFGPWTKNHPFEVEEVGAMREKGTYFLGQWHWNGSVSPACCLYMCLSGNRWWHLCSSCPLGLSSSCWLLGFADFSMWYHFFFCL